MKYRVKLHTELLEGTSATATILVDSSSPVEAESEALGTIKGYSRRYHAALALEEMPVEPDPVEGGEWEYHGVDTNDEVEVRTRDIDPEGVDAECIEEIEQ